jgi:hypothetical protein
MRKVEAAAEQTAHVPPEVVWSLLSDVMVYPQWGPWRKSGYRSEGDAAAHGKGAVYWLEGSKRYGFRYPVSVEEIKRAIARGTTGPPIMKGVLRAYEMASATYGVRSAQPGFPRLLIGRFIGSLRRRR